jgi:energy-coupling factor transport system ATP-binding protein
MVCKDLLNKNLVSASKTAAESVLMKHSAIKLKNFSFSYDGQRKILNNLSLEIKQGERILILGPSGCGKSSLTLCLNGIIPQLIDGKIEGVLKLEDMDIMRTLKASFVC